MCVALCCSEIPSCVLLCLLVCLLRVVICMLFPMCRCCLRFVCVLLFLLLGFVLLLLCACPVCSFLVVYVSVYVYLFMCADCFAVVASGGSSS